MSLKEYVRKRNFKKTAEPKGGKPSTAGGQRFVIQKHAASRLHYDFRLELDGTLKSWAVPKGVPYAKGERRLAVHVEDHPVSYINFEGTIPQGQYGGGTVMVWDRGTYEPLTDTPAKDLASGKLHFVLQGEKLQGEWYLVRIRDGDEWLLIKGGKNFKRVSRQAENTSVLSGKSMEELASGEGAVWGAKTSRRKASKPSVKRPGKSPKRAVAARARTATRAAKAPPTLLAARIRPAAAAAETPKKTARSTKEAFIEPMKALLVDSPPPGEWLYEIKFDGFRALAFKDRTGTRLLSRNQKDFAARFPAVFDAINALDVDDVILDGEIVALDDRGRSSFQLLQAYNLGEQHPPIQFFVFDLLRLNGRDLRDLPLTERQEELQRLLGPRNDVIRISAPLGGDHRTLLEKARELGLEGLIGKRPDSRYETGERTGSWIKLKIHREQEFVIGGYTPPGGSRPHFGALLVGFYDRGKLEYAGKVGTGFNVKRLKALRDEFLKIATDKCPFDNLPERNQRGAQSLTAAEMRRCHWVKPVLVCQLKFTEWTRDHHLRHPVFLGLREDKNAREVVREEAE
jgi:bifunctional non-homologous end joining protein LigD